MTSTEQESDYPPDPGLKTTYGDSWRPEDKAIESAEEEFLTLHDEEAKKAPEERDGRLPMPK